MLIEWKTVKQWDIAVIGGGVIGLSLAWELRQGGASVLVLERGELGGEASSAAGGMLAWCDPHLPPGARALALLSAECYAGFVSGLEEASGISADLRRVGTIAVDEPPSVAFASDCRNLTVGEAAQLEPDLRASSRNLQWWPEWSIDPRRLMASLIGACRARGVEMMTGVAVREVTAFQGRATGVNSAEGVFSAKKVVNCAGAWAAQISCGVEPLPSPTRPVKGQMLALDTKGLLRHVVRAPEVYLIPRSDGTVVVGATVEEAGFDKVTDAAAIERLRSLAVALVPRLAEAPVRESWAGLRPGSPDGLPILGETSLSGYFVATGHFRDGILLAPGTARVVAQMLLGESVSMDFGGLSPNRLQAARTAWAFFIS